MDKINKNLSDADLCPTRTLNDFFDKALTSVNFIEMDLSRVQKRIIRYGYDRFTEQFECSSDDNRDAYDRVGHREFKTADFVREISILDSKIY